MKKAILAGGFVFLLLVLSFSVCNAVQYLRYNFPDPPFMYRGFSITAFQTIEAVYPGSVAVGSGKQYITVNGRSFTSGTTVEIVPMTNLTLTDLALVSDSKLTFNLEASTAAALGLRDVKIYKTDGTSWTGFGMMGITNTAIKPPINSYSPQSVLAGQTALVTIEGALFDTTAPTSTLEATDPDITISEIVALSSTRIQAKFTASAAASSKTVYFIVKNPSSGGVSDAQAFLITKPNAGLTITGVWPDMKGDGSYKFPQASTIKPFVIKGTGISQGAVAVFTDYNNISYDASAVTVTPEGTWLRIAELSIGPNAMLGATMLKIRNPDGTDSANSFFITVTTQAEFLNTIMNFNYVAGPQGSYINPKTDPNIKFKMTVTNASKVNNARLVMMSAEGPAQITNFSNISPAAVSTVQTASGKVRSFSLRPAATGGGYIGEITTQAENERGEPLTEGFYTTYLVLPNGERVKAVVPIHY